MSTPITARNRVARRHPKQAEAQAVRRRWATIDYVADYLSMSERGVRKMMAEGRLLAYRNGRLIRLDLNEVDQALHPYGGAVARRQQREA